MINKKKQNELILQSALEDFKILKKTYIKEESIFVSLPIRCFLKTAALRGF